MGYFEACCFGLPADVPAMIRGNVSGSTLLYVATPARYRASGMDRRILAHASAPTSAAVNRRLLQNEQQAMLLLRAKIQHR
jgi:hypothetical protein